MPAPVQPAVEREDWTDDALTGGFRVFQRRYGHRYSLDDTLTAWVAARTRPDAQVALDLGCGIGSVLLMVAYKLPHAALWGVEAQEQSYAMACENIARNGTGERVTAVHGDLRDAALVARLCDQAMARLDASTTQRGTLQHGRGFPLITGTPPYLPKEHGTVPPDSQRAHARFELRGGVEAYVQAAARVLAPGGRLVLCAGSRADRRVMDAATSAGLAVESHLPVIPSVQKGVLFSVWTLAHASDVAEMRVEPAFVARDESGGRTHASRELRVFFDLPLAGDEAPSPQQRVRGRAPRPEKT